jgi:multidrug resistance efflux pump
MGKVQLSIQLLRSEKMAIKAIKLAAVTLSLLTLASLAGCNKDQTSAPAAGPQTSSQATQPARTSPATSPAAKPGVASPQPLGSPSKAAAVVRGSGTVAVSTDARLNFDTGGKIAKVAVREGERVTKGTLLTKLDTTSLEATLAQARVAVDQARLAQTQAQAALAAAQFTLDKTKAVSDIKDVIANLEWQLKISQTSLAEAQNAADYNEAGYWSKMVESTRTDLARKNKDLSDLLGKADYSGIITYDVMGQAYDKLTVQDMKMKQLQVDSAQQTIDKSQAAIDQAQKNLNLAQQQLSNATITAPFDGIVATLDVKEGDVVPAPTQASKPIVYFIDPTSMQIDVGVNELDLPLVKLGQKAVVRVDAFPGIKLDGKVTAISPMPVVQGGVVNYPVTVEFTVPQNIEIKVGMDASGAITTDGADVNS